MRRVRYVILKNIKGLFSTFSNVSECYAFSFDRSRKWVFTETKTNNNGIRLNERNNSPRILVITPEFYVRNIGLPKLNATRKTSTEHLRFAYL